jgi:hypothetical protein
MPHPKPPLDKVLPFVVPEGDVEAQLLGWIRGVVESNHELVTVLKRLRISYKTILAGQQVSDADAVLWRAEIALRNAAKAKQLA